MTPGTAYLIHDDSNFMRSWDYWGWQRGCYQKSNGDLYAWSRDSGAPCYLYIYKSTDSGETWARVDEAGSWARPAYDIWACGITRVANIIYFHHAQNDLVTRGGYANVRPFNLYAFDMDTDTWITTQDGLFVPEDYSSNLSDLGLAQSSHEAPEIWTSTQAADLFRQGSDWRIVYNNKWHTVPTPGTYERLGVHTFNGAFVQDQGLEHETFEGGAQGTGELIHAIYSTASKTLGHRIVDGLSLGTREVIPGATLLYANVGPLSTPGQNERCTFAPQCADGLLVVPFIDSSQNLCIAIGTDVASPTWTVETVSAWPNAPKINSLSMDHLVGACITSSKIYVFWSQYDVALAMNHDIYYSYRIAAGSWSTPAMITQSETWHIVDTSTVIANPVNDGIGITFDGHWNNSWYYAFIGVSSAACRYYAV